jgi:hypothetical protein
MAGRVPAISDIPRDRNGMRGTVAGQKPATGMMIKGRKEQAALG